MRYFLFIPILFFVSAMSAQTHVDTIRCGDIIGFGKMVNGKKEGLWKYENKKSHTLVFKGNYHEGLKTGEWTCSNNYEQRIVHYKNNLLDGAVIIYKFKNLYCEGTYRNGLKEGEWKYYNAEPHANTLEHYANGIPVGEWRIWSGYGAGYGNCYVGMMNSYGKNGYWVQKYIDQRGNPSHPGDIILMEVTGDSILYVNGKQSGFHNYTHKFDPGFFDTYSPDPYLFEADSYAPYSFDTYHDENFEHASSASGNFVEGKKEGIWNYGYNYFHEAVEYKNGLREGYDSVWSNHDQLMVVSFYLHDTLNGPQLEFQDERLPYSEGICIPNPQYVSPYHPTIQVPIDLYIDLIENGICDESLYSLDYNSANSSPHNRDSLISLIKETSLHYSAPVITPFSYSPTVRIGHWNFYWEYTGKKKGEGNYLPIVRDTILWDSTNQTEDPNNPGTYILAPSKIIVSTYYKTGWWKFYNEQGVMIREERYDEKGKLKETSLYPYNTSLTSPPSFSTTGQTGHWNYYWETGKKKEEGDFVSMSRDSFPWDSITPVEDPNNPGTYIAPVKPNSPVYCKTGWWKYYNEQGILIREERYEKGELVETKKAGQ